MVSNKQMVIRRHLESGLQPNFTLEMICPINLKKLKDRVILKEDQQNVLLSTRFESFLVFEKFISRIGFKIVETGMTFDVTDLNKSMNRCTLITKESFKPRDITMIVMLAHYEDGSFYPMNLIDFTDRSKKEKDNTIEYKL